MNSISPLIEFIQKHHVLSLASQGEDGPHVTPLFYAFDSKKHQFVFISDPTTRHMKEILINPCVAAGIYLETEKLDLIQGAQIWGSARLNDTREVEQIYLKRFPMTRPILMEKPLHRFCTLDIKKSRLIDNTLNFGKKMEWSFEEGFEYGNGKCSL